MKYCHILITIARRAKISSFLAPWGRKRVHMKTLGPFFKFQIEYPNMEMLKIVLISKTDARRATVSSISSPWGQKKSTYASFGPFFKLQISCPNMEVIKIDPYLENGWPYSENKLNFSPPPGVEREYISNYGTFLLISDFMSNYGHFENRPVSRKLLLVQEK